MKPLNHTTSTMPSSGIRKIMSLSEHVPDCIHLEVGQPDFATPGHILEAISRAAADSFTQYTHGAGIMELREAITEKVSMKNGFTINYQNVVVSPGAVCSLMTTLLAVVEAGDEVLVPDPGWPNYMMQMACIGARGVRYPLDLKRGFLMDLEALEHCITPRTKAVIINTPSNPAGAVFLQEDVERIVEISKKHDLYIISDEVYEDIVFDGAHTSFGRYNDDGRIIVIFGFSKTYAVTGLRVGYTVCEEKLARLVTKLQEPVVSCASSISQKACVAALKGPQESVATMVKAYKQRRDAVIGILKERGLFRYVPRGAFYMLVDISRTGMNSLDFAVRLLNEKKVAVAPGETFGDTVNSFVRISFATDTEKLLQGVGIICGWIEEHST